MLELPSFLRLSDYLIRLLEERNKRTKAYFETIVKPCFENAKAVRDDLLTIFNQIAQKVRDGADVRELEELLEVARPRFKGDRDTLRGILGSIPKDRLTEFEQAILLMIGGGLSHILENLAGEIVVIAIEIEVDTKRASARPLVHPLRDVISMKILDRLDKARAHVEKTWKLAAKGYGYYAVQYSQQ